LEEKCPNLKLAEELIGREEIHLECFIIGYLGTHFVREKVLGQ
jgi:hypothetical protein